MTYILVCLTLGLAVSILWLVRDHLALQALADAQRRRIELLERENKYAAQDHKLELWLSRQLYDILRDDRDRLRANQHALLYHGYRIPVRPGARLLLWPEPAGWSIVWRN